MTEKMYVFKPMIRGVIKNFTPVEGTFNCESFPLNGDGDDPYLHAYPFLADSALRITVAAGCVYTIAHDDDSEVIRMHWSTVEQYRSSQPAELPSWCAMYDCLIQRSEILKSYYPLDNHK